MTDINLELFFEISTPILMVLIYLAVWAGEHLADCQDEIEVKDDRAKALRSL